MSGTATVDRRVIIISAVAVVLALVASLVAPLLTRLIGLITNLAFYGRLSSRFSSPAGNHLGALVIVGALIVGLMARHGSKAIRGHGIPEAMEQVLFNQSRIPPLLIILKPLSAAIAIGTGGPFGAEGPIIATGSALGSLVGQVLTVTTDERKTLLAAGAVAGMAATFGTPVSAVLLAIELLLFEFRPRSVIPVALAASAATAARAAMVGYAPVFSLPDLAQPSGAAIAAYVALGGVVGVASVLVTRGLYAIEDGFEKLPVHWMWWPAIGAVAVGVVTRSEIFDLTAVDERPIGSLVSRPAVVLDEQSSARDAADRMVMERVGRLVIVDAEDATRVVGIVTRRDLLEALRRRLDEASLKHVALALPRLYRFPRRRERHP